MTTHVLVVAGLDATDQAVTAMGLQCDLPDSAVVRLVVDAAAGEVRWAVSDLTGIVEEAGQEVRHPCLSCSLREAILPTLVRLAETGRWGTLVVALPVAAEPLPLALGIARAHLADGRRVADHLDLRSVVTVVSCEDLCAGVFDDPLLAELDLAMVDDDRRSYGETLVNQVELADVVVLAHELDESDRALLDHLRRPDSSVAAGLSTLSGAELLLRGCDVERSSAFVDPRRRRATGAAPAGGLQTLTLRTWRPFHPDRLRQHLEDLGSGELRGRGAFWLPGRPGTAIAWDASGGQLSIGAIGGWDDADRMTNLLVTTDAETATVVREAFEAAVMTEAEMLTARDRWMGRRDGFEEWLGEEGASDVA
ncbi:CobW family GTP-binding protein [Arsenicicoccus sp. oral taxon 190]|uniref:CobW family GTP-binding protein n=1 Tax=Arsenicicoccus sp. oral taxon 190 TaxID=1658671 RepID=UPI00067C1EB6|nr:GTP-binding protein [Arsenicicoccus sp. oral taxon 190]